MINTIYFITCIFVILTNHNVIFIYSFILSVALVCLHMNSCCGVQSNETQHLQPLKKIKYIFAFLLFFYFSQLAHLSSLSILFCISAVHSLNSPWQNPLKDTRPSFKSRPLHHVCTCCTSRNYSEKITRKTYTNKTCNMLDCTHSSVLCHNDDSVQHYHFIMVVR